MRDADAFDRELRTAFGDSRVHRNEPLARLTTFRVGGRADWLLELRSGDEVGRAAAFASREGIPITVLGGGSNVLVSDRGVRGIVVRMHGGEGLPRVLMRRDGRDLELGMGGEQPEQLAARVAAGSGDGDGEGHGRAFGVRRDVDSDRGDVARTEAQRGDVA